LKITDKKTGERDGARVVIGVKVIERTVYVLYIYDKAEVSNLNDKQISTIVKKATSKRKAISKLST
jgi:hypothetical protein